MKIGGTHRSSYHNHGPMGPFVGNGDMICYGKRYKDLQHLGDNPDRLRNHFLKTGSLEGRDPYCAHQDSTPAMKDPVHVRIVMRTYHMQLLNVVGSLSSIVVAAEGRESWLNVSIVVLNTGDGEEYHDRLLGMVEQVASTLRGASSRKIEIETRPWVQDIDQTYGYMASDLELERIKSSTEQRPDYLLFCNGDTYYAEETFDSVRFYLEARVGMVGMNWVPTMRHVGSEGTRSSVKQCRFAHGGVDLNGVFLNLEAIVHVDASFSSVHTPCARKSVEAAKRGCQSSDPRPYFVADW